MDGSEITDNSLDDKIASESQVNIEFKPVDNDVNSNGLFEKMSNLAFNPSPNEIKDTRKREQQYLEQSSFIDPLKKRVVADESINNYSNGTGTEKNIPQANLDSSEMYVDPQHFGFDSRCKGDDFSDSCSQSSSRSTTLESMPIEQRITTSSVVSSENISSCVGSNNDNRNTHSTENALTNDSSFTFLRESSISSSKQDNFSVRESSESSSSAQSSRNSNVVIQPGELTDKLVEGPLITLPPTQVLVTSNNSSPLNVATLVDKGSKYVPTEADLQHKCIESEHTPAGSVIDPKLDKHPNDQSQNIVHADVVDKGASDVANNCLSGNSSSSTEQTQSKPRLKKTPNDFIFGKVIGEGSYSTVSAIVLSKFCN